MQYFGERFDKGGCRGTCDNCRDPRPLETIDLTDLARDTIRCVRGVCWACGGVYVWFGSVQCAGAAPVRPPTTNSTPRPLPPRTPQNTPTTTPRLVDSLVSQGQQFTLCQLASLVRGENVAFARRTGADQV